MRVVSVVHDSIVDGPGLRSTVFFAGCPHQCKGCHNPQTWNSNGGVEMSVEQIYEELMSNPLTNVTFSGGEPLMQSKQLYQLAKKLKKAGKEIWCYTGFTWEELMAQSFKTIRALLVEMDVLVDGRFQLEERDLTLLYRGSRNQRIIQCKESLLKGEIVYFEH